MRIRHVIRHPVRSLKNFIKRQKALRNTDKPLKNLTSSIRFFLKKSSENSEFVPVSFQHAFKNSFDPEHHSVLQDPIILQSENNYSQFCQKNADAIHSFCPIPTTIHLIWLGGTPAPHVKLIINSWKKYHPKWEVKLWTEKECQMLSFAFPRSQILFDQSKSFSEKSDVLRFEILYQFGGIYADTDMVCLKSFDSILSKCPTFFCSYENTLPRHSGKPRIGCALIGAEKHHPILKRTIELSQAHAEAPTISHPDRSGPGPFTHACYEALEKMDDHPPIIFPYTFFYPFKFVDRQFSPRKAAKSIQPESYAIHLWEGSWFN